MPHTLDRVYWWYFVAHVPITVLIDSTIVIPKDYQLAVQKWILNFHLAANKDFLLEVLPLWLRVFGLFELVVQLPMFVIGAYKLQRHDPSVWPLLIVYGFNASFTTLVCLVYAWYEGPAYGLSDPDIYKLIAVYLPYFVLPLIMLVDGYSRVVKALIKTKLD